MSTAIAAPRKNVLIGITHTKEGQKIIREPKILKVGVGLSRGKAVDVFVDPDGNWNIRMGKSAGGKLKFETVAKVKTRAEAESAWRKAYEEADLCGYPRKVPYFVFTRPIVGRDGSEVYIPDFAATEAYSFADENRIGAPTEIDVVFLDDDPFTGAYAMWSSSELRCTGDGENASRSVAMYDDEKKVPEQFREDWRAAKQRGDRTFPIGNGCWTCNCPYSKEQNGKPSACKPSGDLKFQLSRNIRVGGTAFFHTSGYRSIVQIFSAVERIKELTGGRIAGIPLKMVLRSYKTNHNGQSALQSGVSIEFRAEDMESVRKNLIEQAWKFRAASGIPAPARMIESGDTTETIESTMGAQAMVDEFYPDNDDDGDAPATTNAPAAEKASQSKISEIGEKLAASAQPSNVTEMPSQGEKAPWKNRIEMHKFMTPMAEMVERGGIGKSEFDHILARHGQEWAKMQWDSAEALACYREMEKVRAEVKNTPNAETAEKPLF